MSEASVPGRKKASSVTGAAASAALRPTGSQRPCSVPGAARRRTARIMASSRSSAEARSPAPASAVGEGWAWGGPGRMAGVSARYGTSGTRGISAGPNGVALIIGISR